MKLKMKLKMAQTVRHQKNIKKGDNVYVIAGNEKGLSGTVLSRTNESITIQGINVKKKHVKKSELHPQGGIIQFEKSIHISNVAPNRDAESTSKVNK